MHYLIEGVIAVTLGNNNTNLEKEGMIIKTHEENNRSMLKNGYPYAKRNIWSGFLFGIGLAFIDETFFHQLLRWHHFYDKSTTDIGLISDGFFHAFSWFATIAGLCLLDKSFKFFHTKACIIRRSQNNTIFFSYCDCIL
ncbi:hypothetical protein LSPH24S_06093 [Lysinibacillus sphaericus]